jgi:Insertion element 4 transposase N-terminal/Transposase DDE domain
MRLQQALEQAAEFSKADSLDRLREHLPAEWIEAALSWAGTATVRRRRLPAEQVVWVVIGMGLMRNEPIERVVDELELALPDRHDTLVAKSAITQARQRLGEDPLAYLFATSAAQWATRSADAHRWRGFSLYGMDGSTLRVADSPENRAEFGGQDAGGGRGTSGYPLVRIVAMMALRSHVLSAFRFAPYSVGETTLARELWKELPENSLVIVDRNFLIKRDLLSLELSGNRQWLSRTKVNTRWAVKEKLGKDDYLVELEVHETGLPKTWPIRAIHYKRKGHPRSTLLTSLVDAEKYPARELVALYHERWETEIAYDEVKTHLLDRQETIRSRSVQGVRQELWGIALAYNLVRVEMERVAAEAGVPPTRISFTAALALIREAFWWMGGGRFAYGTLPRRLLDLRRNLKRLLLPERRTDRAYPRAVKVKMSSYPRKRPSKRPAKRRAK